jgi:regulator of sirC expression with transglutaminase-like and TPR domain
MKEARALVAGDAPIADESMKPATKKEIVLRMIRNLMSRALESANPEKNATPYFNLLLTIDPDAFRERFTRARLREVAGDFSGAGDDVNWLLAHPPKGLDEPAREALEAWLVRLHERQ